MKTVLNILWFLLGGLPLALGYAIAGAILALTIVGVPFAVASFRLASYALWPFGRTVVPQVGAGTGAGIGNVLWFLLAGWWLALLHATSAIALATTIIGIPLAVAELKLIPLALFPVGKTIVPTNSIGLVPVRQYGFTG